MIILEKVNVAVEAKIRTIEKALCISAKKPKAVLNRSSVAIFTSD